MSNVPVTPKHYRNSYFQPIEIISAWNLSFALGNVLKYICRAGKKESASVQEDLQKALWYLCFELTDDADVADAIVKRIESDV